MGQIRSGRSRRDWLHDCLSYGRHAIEVAMRRWVFRIASVISLLLCFATMYAYSRAYMNRYEIYAGRLTPEGDQSATVYGLRVQYASVFFVYKSGQTLLPDSDFHAEAWRNSWPMDGWRDVPSGFEILSYETSPSGSVYDQLIVPDRYLIALFAVLPACGALRLMFVIWRTMTRKAGACYGCGYDLTGNTSGVCPECGRPLPGAGPATATSMKAIDARSL